jgi:hypothetical protein
MTLKELILKQITESETPILLRSDFVFESNFEYITRVLKRVVDEGYLIKAGQGIFVRARSNRITGGIMCDHNNGVDGALIEILERLAIPYDISQPAKDYINGHSTQIPATLHVTPSKSFKRKLSIGHYKFNY